MTSDAERAEYRRIRGLDDRPWYPTCGICPDYTFPVGDWAETFAYWLLGGSFNSQLAGKPTPAQLAALKPIFTADAAVAPTTTTTTRPSTTAPAPKPTTTPTTTASSGGTTTRYYWYGGGYRRTAPSDSSSGSGGRTRRGVGLRASGAYGGPTGAATTMRHRGMRRRARVASSGRPSLRQPLPVRL